jgi:hypothetical protein
MKLIFYFIAFIFLMACGGKVVPSTTKKQEIASEYYEDLSEYRPNSHSENEISKNNENTVAPSITTEKLYINEKLDAILAERSEKNKAVKYANGFRIQLYAGRERKIVDDAKMFIHQTYPNINPYLTYSLPIYKLKFGDFLTKNDAERMLAELKSNFPDAIVVAEKIDLKKSFSKE